MSPFSFVLRILISQGSIKLLTSFTLSKVNLQTSLLKLSVLRSSLSRSLYKIWHTFTTSEPRPKTYKGLVSFIENTKSVTRLNSYSNSTSYRLRSSLRTLTWYPMSFFIKFFGTWSVIIKKGSVNGGMSSLAPTEATNETFICTYWSRCSFFISRSVQIYTQSKMPLKIA